MNAVPKEVQDVIRDEGIVRFPQTNSMRYLGGVPMGSTKDLIVGPLIVACFTAILTVSGVALTMWKMQGIMQLEHSIFTSELREHERRIETNTKQLSRMTGVLEAHNH